MSNSPSEQCKAEGLQSFAELVRISGVSVQTLINWHRNKPILFNLIICGAVNKIKIKTATRELLKYKPKD